MICCINVTVFVKFNCDALFYEENSMTMFKTISAYDLKQLSLKEAVKIVDIRDQQTYNSDHLDDAFHLTNVSIETFIKETPLDTTVYVICYHGNSSKGAAEYLCEQGYANVYSVDGGMVGWRLIDPLA